MTNRYDLLIDAIYATDLFIMKMFLYAMVAVLAYASLAWIPAWMRRPAQVSFKALALIGFIFVTVYSALQ